jgi:hypothetical protein
MGLVRSMRGIKIQRKVLAPAEAVENILLAVLIHHNTL